MINARKINDIKTVFYTILGLVTFYLDKKEELNRIKKLDELERNVERLNKRVFGNVIDC